MARSVHTGDAPKSPAKFNACRSPFCDLCARRRRRNLGPPFSGVERISQKRAQDTPSIRQDFSASVRHHKNACFAELALPVWFEEKQKSSNTLGILRFHVESYCAQTPAIVECTPYASVISVASRVSTQVARRGAAGNKLLQHFPHAVSENSNKRFERLRIPYKLLRPQASCARFKSFRRRENSAASRYATWRNGGSEAR